MMKQKSKALLALTTTALALPGISTESKAATYQPYESSVNYRSSKYQEDDSPSNRVTQGSSERYDIDIHQLGLSVPVARSFSLDLNAQYEVLSGASPWSNSDPDADGNPDLVMSSASIEDTRTDLSIKVNHYFSNSRVGLTLAGSREDDYESDSAGFDWEGDFNNKQTTFNLGLSYSDDVIEPETGAINLNSIDPVVGEEEKESVSFYTGVGQVINKVSVIQSGISYTGLDGHLSDPYKLVDRRPDSRDQYTWTLRYRHFYVAPDAALHADYRYYQDSWGIKSHTIKMEWHQSLGNEWQFIPSLRYYSQSKADFYVSIDDELSTANHFSSDFRLSNYGAVSGGLIIVKKFNKISVSLSAERYVSRKGYALSKDSEPENQGLVSFNLITLGLDYSF